MRSRLALALVCGLFAAGPVCAADPDPKARVEVPYRLTDTKHIMVRAKINGKGPFNMIIDTGAPAVFITKGLAKKVEADVDEKGWTNFDSFEIEGGLKVEKARGRVEDLVQLDGMNGLGLAGVELHGVIGYNVLSRFRIQFDFTADKLVFEPLTGFDPPPLVPLGGKANSDLQAMGPLMKTLVALMGIKPNFETVPRGFLGIEFDDADGVTVKAVLPGTPAEKAGLKAGDQIVSVKDTDVEDGKDLAKALAKAGVGAKVPFTLKRGNKTQTVEVELGRGL
ncbi:MAG TPA: PDZ domain-containing protein [Gemmataceae bacterium]|nr:PDZ domain-containing protein [Gemmataceae bacterium]